jgi:5-methylcytosine-specific restriction endonuclease McrA
MPKKNRLANSSGNRNCDICGDVEYLEEHHIRGRKIKNANKMFNIANICPNCHYKVHLGDIIIEDWKTTEKGRKLIWHEKGNFSITGDDAKTHQI